MGAWLGPRWNEAIGLRRCDLDPLRHEVTFGKVVVERLRPLHQRSSGRSLDTGDSSWPDVVPSRPSWLLEG
jgi:hypothetical protein